MSNATGFWLRRRGASGLLSTCSTGRRSSSVDRDLGRLGGGVSSEWDSVATGGGGDSVGTGSERSGVGSTDFIVEASCTEDFSFFRIAGEGLAFVFPESGQSISSTDVPSRPNTAIRAVAFLPAPRTRTVTTAPALAF